MSIDIEAALVAWLQTNISAHVSTELGAGFVSPAVNLVRIGGGDADYLLDHATVDIDVYHATRGQAFDLALQIHDLFRQQLPNAVIAGVVITQCLTSIGPRWTPYDDLSKRRVSATYTITAHAV